jgi:type IV secretion system protein VirB10
MSDPTRPRASPDEILPVVASPSGNRAVWIFAGGIALAGGLLFQTLEARRTSLAQPFTVAPRSNGAEIISSPPQLDIPASADSPENYDQTSRYAMPSSRFGPKTGAYPEVRTPTGLDPSAARQPGPSITPFESGPSVYSGSPPAVASSAPKSSDRMYSGPKPSANGESDSAAQGRGPERVEARKFENPGTTVPKGAVIQAVLETALDSTRAGFARAIVSRDVHSFDGSRVLIPRGSRLIGEYKADVTIGQKRALIQWQRLVRPDGILINLDSPAADPLGRAGVGGKVKTHFFERFAGSILQSTLDLGVQLASQRLSRETYILALPNATQDLVRNQGDRIPPTVIVRQGSSVSVFVARDLDFTVVT